MNQIMACTQSRTTSNYSKLTHYTLYVHPDVQKIGQLRRQLVGCWLGHTSCMGLIPVAHLESGNIGGQLVVPAVATQDTFLGAHRTAVYVVFPPIRPSHGFVILRRTST